MVATRRRATRCLLLASALVAHRHVVTAISININTNFSSDLLGILDNGQSNTAEQPTNAGVVPAVIDGIGDLLDDILGKRPTSVAPAPTTTEPPPPTTETPTEPPTPSPSSETTPPPSDDVNLSINDSDDAVSSSENVETGNGEVTEEDDRVESMTETTVTPTPPPFEGPDIVPVTNLPTEAVKDVTNTTRTPEVTTLPPTSTPSSATPPPTTVEPPPSTVMPPPVPSQTPNVTAPSNGTITLPPMASRVPSKPPLKTESPMPTAPNRQDRHEAYEGAAPAQSANEASATRINLNMTPPKGGKGESATESVQSSSQGSFYEMGTASIMSIIGVVVGICALVSLFVVISRRKYGEESDDDILSFGDGRSIVRLSPTFLSTGASTRRGGSGGTFLSPPRKYNKPGELGTIAAILGPPRQQLDLPPPPAVRDQSRSSADLSLADSRDSDGWSSVMESDFHKSDLSRCTRDTTLSNLTASHHLSDYQRSDSAWSNSECGRPTNRTVRPSLADSSAFYSVTNTSALAAADQELAMGSFMNSSLQQSRPHRSSEPELRRTEMSMMRMSAASSMSSYSDYRPTNGSSMSGRFTTERREM